MNIVLTTMCAASLGAAPAPTGVSPESFTTAFRQVVAAETVAAETATGEVVSIAEDKASFVILVDGKRMTVRVDAKTTYALDGESSTRDAALRVGRTAKVTHDQGLATRVEASTARDGDGAG